MENTNSSLAHRQLDVIRKNLLSVFRFAVKALIDKACFCSIDDGCEEFINFSATIEHILQHRLRPSKAWYLGDDRSHFWFYIKTACHRQDLRGCITNIDNIENIKSPVAKGRAFVRCALMEKRLSEYLGEALKQTHITRRFYKPGAIMLGEEATELCGTLLGLNSIDFGFCVKGENYDTVECPLVISYFPFMKFRQRFSEFPKEVSQRSEYSIYAQPHLLKQMLDQLHTPMRCVKPRVHAGQESLHSDMEEMRELSCGSSLASEDGQEVQDTPPNDPWPDRYNLLHKRYMRVLEQKSFLEEVMASQEKALQAAAGVQQEVGRMQRDTAFQKQQYEGVILELQAQVTRMKTIHEALQQQLMSTRGARYPLVEMDPRRAGEATRFAAAMGHKLESDRQSLTSSLDRGSVGRPATGGDTRSLASALSEISVDVVGQGQTTPRPPGEDSQSMVPLTGSLGDLHLALEPGTAVSESSMAVNPEQSTPVVSVSSGLYTSAFEEEINGNGGGAERSDAPLSEATLCKMLSVQVSQSEERDGDHATEDPQPQTQDSSLTASAGAATATATATAAGAGGGRETARNQNRGDAAIPDSGKEREESENVPPESAEESSPTETPNGGASLVQSYDIIPGSENVSDRQSEASGSSEPEVLVAEENVSGGASSSAGDQDSQEAEVLSHMTSSKESALSDKDDSSEPEVLAQEDEDIDGENATADVREPASASPDREEEEAASDPEILDEVSSVVGKEHSDLTPSRESRLQGTAYESWAQEGASSLADVPSSDREETSDPEILTREETGTADSDSRENGEESEQEPASDQNQSSSEVPKVKPRLAEPPSAPSSTAEASLPEGDNSQSKETAGAEEREKEGVSDSGSSDENKDTWDMLSDANHDSSL